MTDIGPADRATLHAIACRTLGIGHLRTRPYRPQTNGKAERFIRTMLGGWAYGAIYRSSAEHNAALAGWVLHIENHQRYKRSGAEQFGHDEQRETETGGRRFAVTVAGLGFGFHLSSPFKRLSPHSASRGLREPKTVHRVCPSHPWKPLVCSLAASDVDAESGRRSIEADYWRGDAGHAEP